MKSIGVVICNYNKCEYVLRCIQSVLESRQQDFDIYIVDNHSEDDSVEKIRQLYGNRVTLLENPQNLGGSGGFNRGIGAVLEAGYEYLLCLDNDAVVDENAIEELRSFLEAHPDVGMAGSKVYHAQVPGYVQQMGIIIDFERFGLETLYGDIPDGGDIPEVVYCDAVAACSVMLPVHVVKEAGGMPEDNFIYFDDVEWGYLVKRKGYKVAAVGASRVLHEMGAMDRRKSTFSSYYHWRNYLHFFMKYTPEERLEEMSIALLSDLYEAVYLNLYREEHEIVKTILFAYQDVLSGLRGKALAGKILPAGIPKNKFENLAGEAATYWASEEDRVLEPTLKRFRPEIIFEERKEKANLRLRLCKNILGLKDFSMEYSYVDENFDVASDENDIEVIRNYPYSLQLFIYMNQENLLYAAERLR